MAELTYAWREGLPKWLEPEATTQEEANALREWSKNVRARHCNVCTDDDKEFSLVVEWRHAEAYTGGLPENCYESDDYDYNFAIYDDKNDEILSGEGDEQDAQKALEEWLKTR